MEQITIVGQGLMGTCLAWRLHQRGLPFRLLDRDREQGSSRAAAGLITPITGKGLNPSWRQTEFLPQAIAFYEEIEAALGIKIWNPVAIARLFGAEKERIKWEGKRCLESHRGWATDGALDLPSEIKAPLGGFLMRGGGWVNLPEFLDHSRGFFDKLGYFQKVESFEGEQAEGSILINCRGAAELIEEGRPHRCAKGEILTVKIPGLGLKEIVNRSGWLVPLGDDAYRAGATYGWDELDENATQAGLDDVRGIIRTFTDLPFEMIDHVAGIRPIVRQSIPVVSREGSCWNINGLGSKGSMYAPALASHIVEAMHNECSLDPELRL